MDNEHAPRRAAGARRKAAPPLPGEEWLAKRTGSGFWHYDFSIEGHRLRGSCGTGDKADAARLAQALYDREWRRIKLGEKPAVHLTLEEAFTGWWRDRGQHGKYGVTGQRYQLARILRILGGTTALTDLDNATVARLLRGLRDGEGVTDGHETQGKASASTCNRYLSTLNTVCTWAREIQAAKVGSWAMKPHMQAEPPPKDRFLLHEEARTLIDAIAPHARAPIALALLTGLRRNNWLLLDWQNVSLDMRRALLIGKGNKPLGVSLSPPAVALLERLQPDPDKRRAGPVFVYGAVPCECPHCASPANIGQPIRDIRRSFKTAARRADVPNLRIHDLRHSFAAWLLEATGDLRMVGDALHHQQVTTTARYARLMPGRLEQGVDRVAAAFERAAILHTEPKKKDQSA